MKGGCRRKDGIKLGVGFRLGVPITREKKKSRKRKHRCCREGESDSSVEKAGGVEREGFPGLVGPAKKGIIQGRASGV